MAGANTLYRKSIASPLEDAKNIKLNQSLIRYMEQLQISNNPRDVAIAVQFIDFHESIHRADKPINSMLVMQLKNVILQSPDDVDIAWMEALGCGRLEAACDPENAITRLKRLEPENLAVYLLAFNRADKAGDNRLRLSELHAMANSGYSDIHYSSISKLYYEAFRGWHTPIKISAKELFGDDSNQAPVTDDEARKVVSMGYSMAMGLPTLQQLSTYCKAEKLPADQLQYCQKIATVMIKDKTLIMHRIGLRIGVEVFMQEPAASQWREAYRVSYWQLSGHGHDPNGKTKSNERKYFNQWPNADEVGQQKQRLIDKGIPLTPPAGWMPESEEIQKLLKAPIATKP